MYRLHDVFISYRRSEGSGNEQGKQIAQIIYQYLSQKGLRVFWDIEEMENGVFTDQLQWQVGHTPNYLFVATNSAIHFRNGPDPDYVQEEVSLALKRYEEYPNDRMLLVIKPSDTPYPAEMDRSFSEEIHRLFKHRVLEMTSQVLSSADETLLKAILKNVTEVKRRNLWNAGHRWLEEAKKPGNRFASFSIDKSILPLAGKNDEAEKLLPICVGQKDQNERPLMDMIRETPGHLYLIGEGGIGKTTALLNIMEYVYGPETDEQTIERNRLNGQVPIFIELSKAPDTYGRLYEGGKSTFIQRSVYQMLRTDLRVKQMSRSAVEDVQVVFNMDPDTAVRPIHDLFTQHEPAPEYLLLLDGLNEVSRSEIGYKYVDGNGSIRTGTRSVISMITEEIRMLLEDCPNVRVILTSRSEEFNRWNNKLTVLYLSGVSDETIDDYLISKHVAQKSIDDVGNNEHLKEILRIPLFLTMYSVLEGKENVRSRGEILHAFFHQKGEAFYNEKRRKTEIDNEVEKASSAVQKNRLTADMQSFIVDFILPEIAWHMVKSDCFYMRRNDSKEQKGLQKIIQGVLEGRGETDICGENGKYAFTEYGIGSAKTNTRKTAKEICKRLNGDEEDEEDAWDEIIGSILDCAVFALGILQMNSSTRRIEYGFIHHHIRDYFAAKYQMNRLFLAVYIQENGDNETARQCLNDWKEYPLPAIVRRLIGEALGETQNAPVCDENGCWHSNIPKEPCERNLIARAFDVFRNRFDGKDGYCVWNLLEIIKDVRNDLCNADFSNLDFTGCEINSHSIGHHGISACMDGAKISDKFFFPDGNRGIIRAAVFTPDGKYIAILSDRESRVIILNRESGMICRSLELPASTNMYVSSHAIVCDREGKYLIACCKAEILIWSLVNWKQVATIAMHNGTIRSVAISPDNRYLMTASYDHTIEIVNLQSILGKIEAFIIDDNALIETFLTTDTKLLETPLVRFDDKEQKIKIQIWEKPFIIDTQIYRIRFATFSHDGKYFVTAIDDKSVILWETETRKPIRWVLLEQPPVMVLFTSDDTKILCMEENTKWITVISMDDFKQNGTVCHHTGRIENFEISADGRYLVTAARDGEIKLWEMDTFRALSVIEKKGSGLKDFAIFSPDGRFVASSTREEVFNIWDMNRYELISAMRVVDGTKAHRWSIAYRPDMKIIVTASNEDPMIRIWDAADFRMIAIVKGHQDRDIVYDVLFSPDGRIFITRGAKESKVWDSQTFHVIFTLEAMDSIACTNNLIFGLDKKRRFCAWRINTWEKTGPFDHNACYAFAIRPESQYGVFCEVRTKEGNVAPLPFEMPFDRDDFDYFLTMRELQDGSLINEIRIPDMAYHIAFSQDAKNIFVTGRFGVIIFQNDHTLNIIETENKITNRTDYVSFSEHGKWMLSNGIKECVLRKADTFEPVKQFIAKGTSLFSKCVFSPDGNYFILVKDNGADGTTVWSTETLEQVADLGGYLSYISFSPDGKHILLSGFSGTRIYSAATFECERSFEIYSRIEPIGIDLRYIHPDSRLSQKAREVLKEHGAII